MYHQICKFINGRGNAENGGNDQESVSILCCCRRRDQVRHPAETAQLQPTATPQAATEQQEKERGHSPNAGYNLGGIILSFVVWIVYTFVEGTLDTGEIAHMYLYSFMRQMDFFGRVCDGIATITCLVIIGKKIPNQVNRNSFQKIKTYHHDLMKQVVVY